MMQPSASELGELEGRKSTLSCLWWNVRIAAIHRTIRAKRLWHMSCHQTGSGYEGPMIRWHHAAVLCSACLLPVAALRRRQQTERRSATLSSRRAFLASGVT
jgi:hypothetical protein